MTPSLRAGGSGPTVLLSVTFAGAQVHSRTNIFCTISGRKQKHRRLIFLQKKRRLNSFLSSQVTPTTLTVKIACLYSSMAATGTTTPVSRTEVTSANGEVRAGVSN